MEQENNIPKPFEAFLVILGSYLFFILFTGMLFTLFTPGSEQPDPGSLNTKFLFVIGELSLAVVPFIFLKKRNYSLPDILRWRSVPNKVFYLIIPIGFSITIVSDELDRLIRMLFPVEDKYETMIAEAMHANTGFEFLLIFLSVVILASVVEEAIFRGFLQNSLEHHLNINRAVIYGSLAWTILHLNEFTAHTAIPVFLFGVLLGYLAWRTNSILPTMICHAINNGLALLYFNINFEESLSLYEWKGHVNPLLLGAAIFILVRGIQYIDQFYRSEDLASSNNNASD